MNTNTLVSLFYAQAEQRADKPALLEKQEGVYREVPWRQLAENVRAIAAGLLASGVQPGDRVGILSENRREWIEADFAILSTGAITVALHAPLTPAQVKEQFMDSAPVVVFVSTADQRDKLLSIRAAIPSIRLVVAFEANAGSADVEPLCAFMQRGREYLVAHPDALASRIAMGTPEDLAAITYTSGTTGESKGVMLTHNNLVSNIRALEKAFPSCTDTISLVFLPLSHIYARTCDLYMSVAVGGILALAESIDTILQNFCEVRPHHFSAVPRIHQKLAALARPAFEAGHRAALQELLGGRVEWCTSGGAALPVDIAKFYFEAGVPIYQGYGLTETSPVISFSYAQKWRIGSAGVPIAGAEVKIAPDGEILTRGPHVMKGYWNKPEATAEVFDSEGWFHTGDIGYLDEDGFLYITDRKKDILVTAYGKNVAPQQIEGLLTLDPFIEQAFIYGDGKPYLTALIIPARERLMAWAKEQGLGEMSLAELATQAAIHTLYEERIREALRDLAPYEQVRKFAFRLEPFSYATGEMTLTAKLRRKQIIESARETLERLYLQEE
jgi:long-chain acyl-CoA synthetase